jgi:hypothetical protein
LSSDTEFCQLTTVGAPTAPLIVDALLSHFLLFSIGFSLLYNFVLHTFFGEMTAVYIGWKDSPFQAEVGFASLGYAILGFLAFRRSFDLRLAAVVGPALFFMCAGIAHIRRIVIAHNYAPGNAGLFLYMDLVIPLVGVLLLWLQHRYPIADDTQSAPVYPVALWRDPNRDSVLSSALWYWHRLIHVPPEAFADDTNRDLIWMKSRFSRHPKKGEPPICSSQHAPHHT